MSESAIKTNQQLRKELESLKCEMAGIEAETVKVKRELQELERQAVRAGSTRRRGVEGGRSFM